MAHFRPRACSCMWCSSFRWDPGSSNKGNKRQSTDKTLSTGVHALVLNSREELFTWRYMRRLRKTHRTMWPVGVKCITKGGEQLDSLSNAGWTSRSTGAFEKAPYAHFNRNHSCIARAALLPVVKNKRVSSFSNAETIVLLFCLITDKAALRIRCTARTPRYCCCSGAEKLEEMTEIFLRISFNNLLALWQLISERNLKWMHWQEKGEKSSHITNKSSAPISFNPPYISFHVVFDICS